MLLDPTELSNKASIGFCQSSVKPKGEAALWILTCQSPLTPCNSSLNEQNPILFWPYFAAY